MNGDRSAKSRKGQTYRHVPAFILLFLAREDLYGGAILNKMHKELPGLHPDGAVVYRSLADLEEEGAVSSYWETDVPGPARRWYRIEARGWQKLAEFKADIEMRMKNFNYFLENYGRLSGPLPDRAPETEGKP